MRWLPSGLVSVLVLLLRPAAGSAEDSWNASWIAVAPADKNSDEDRINSWSCYRKELHFDTAPSKASIRIACDSKYWLWINGRMVVFEGQLKRGPTPRDTYYDEVELADEFSAGKNMIAILSWHFGKHGFSHKDSGQAGLICELTVDGRTIGSDDTWRAVRHPAYGDTGEPRPNWRLPESNVRYDARRQLGPWRDVDFDDDAWTSAVELGRPPCEPWGQLVKRPIPQWKISPLRDYENAADLPSVSDGQLIVARLPYNAQVTPYLEVDAAAGRTIDIRTDNYRGGGEPNVRAEYVTRSGPQQYESLGWMNGHEVHYALPAGIKILGLKYRESGYDADFAGSFRCDDPFLNRLWDKAQRTLYLEMRDGFVDCPGRERAQWWGDITLELQQGFYCLDRRADLLARKAMFELCDWQRDDGTLYAPVPSGNWDKELPMQMLASVGPPGFGAYYRHTGDLDAIRGVYPHVTRYLALWQIGDDGLVVQREGGWTWGDWGEHKDMPILYNAWYYHALSGFRELALAVGENDDAAEAEEKRAAIRAHFNARFWTGGEYRSAEHAGPTDDRANALAVVVGLAEPKQFDAIRKVLREQYHAGPYMEKYVLQALYLMGAPDDALARIHKRYGAMVASPLTTLWEGWGVGNEGFGGGSYNHAWSGGPLILMGQYVAGIAPLEPGYARFGVFPQLGPLREAECTVPSVRGEIAVQIRRDDSRLTMQVHVPPGTIGMAGVPAGYARDLSVVDEGEAGAVPPHPRQDNPQFTVFELPPGRWTLQGAVTR